MATAPIIYPNVAALADVIDQFKSQSATTQARLSGLCGFDGFIDTFVRLQTPASMAEFGPKVAAAAGIAASYPAQHLGDKFGGNGPLFAAAMHDIHGGAIDVTYIGAMGAGEVLPIYQEALGHKLKRLYTLAAPAHTTCLEFTDGKVMLCDMATCAQVTWERLLECVGSAALDAELKTASFISAVNWGKLPHAGTIWSQLAQRLADLGVPAKQVVFFMDLAEFETRPMSDREDLLARLEPITRQCRTMLSFNLKEAWQMGEVFGADYHGRMEPAAVTELADLLRSCIAVDRVIIHPNSGAACASASGTVYVPGPFCREPLISTGAGDNFGAGCLAAALRGFDDATMLLAGNCASGHFVRSGRSATFPDMVQLLDAWAADSLAERL
ncbi:MAG: carbohydrate kinase family protein [Verrucomicrobia bacterium]|nr:MAG: carbohydrate kinase family protein [Verrucomicrobiota bacterium]